MNTETYVSPYRRFIRNDVNRYTYNTGVIMEKVIYKEKLEEIKRLDPITYGIMSKSNTDKIIYRIIYILENEGNTEYDLLSEHLNSDDKSKIIFMHVYHHPYNNGDAGRKLVNELEKIGFVHAHFSPSIKDYRGETFGTFIYFNEAGEEFLNELLELKLLHPEQNCVNSNQE